MRTACSTANAGTRSHQSTSQIGTMKQYAAQTVYVQRRSNAGGMRMGPDDSTPLSVAPTSPVEAHLLGQCAFDGPAVNIQPRSKRAWPNTDAPSPYSQRQTFALELKPSCRAPIVGLLQLGGPSAIVRAVRAGIIDSLKRAAIWALSHIGKEASERSAPTFAHHNPASAVVLEHPRLRVVASLARIKPHCELRRIRLAVGAVRRWRFDATTTQHPPLVQLLSSEGQRIAAIAPALPSSVVSYALHRAANHRQTTESGTCVEANQFRH